jgi:hypothetical protein
MIVIGLGVQNGVVMAEQLVGDLASRDLIQLSRFEVFVRLHACHSGIATGGNAFCRRRSTFHRRKPMSRPGSR